MRIAALSDFHIGASEQLDCFRHPEKSFLHTLDRIEREHDHIVLLGDIFQTQYGRRIDASDEAQELERARKRVAGLWKRFTSTGYTYIHGNHDAVAKAELGALSSIRFEADGFVAYLTHGHQFDPLLTRIYTLTRVGTWFSGRVRAVGLGAAADWLEHKDIVIKHQRLCGLDGPYADGARLLLGQQAADVVVLGHTHVPRVTPVRGGTFANTGTCSLGKTMYISIDTKERRVELIKS